MRNKQLRRDLDLCTLKGEIINRMKKAENKRSNEEDLGAIEECNMKYIR